MLFETKAASAPDNLSHFPGIRTVIAVILWAVVYTDLTRCEQTRLLIHLGTMRPKPLVTGVH